MEQLDEVMGQVGGIIHPGEELLGPRIKRGRVASNSGRKRFKKNAQKSPFKTPVRNV